MALYTIADLHLACAVNKPMDIFGGRWQGYMEKIAQRWQAVVKETDTVVLGGDISWGIDFREARADFAYLDRLPGKKIILKGNHDLWWNTVKKMNAFLDENGFTDIAFLHNNCFFYEDIGIAGTRGWFFEENFQQSHDEKIFKRELMRLETSLRLARAGNIRELYCFLHYPPIFTNFCCDEILSLLKKYGVNRCIYGHLHSDSLRFAVEGERDGIFFQLVRGITSISPRFY
jgi:predicted phosphohydrolase